MTHEKTTDKENLEMSNTEVRTTRLSYAWKLCVAFLSIIGTTIVYFGQNFITMPNAGEIITVGFASFAALMFLICSKYICAELSTLKDDNNHTYQQKKVNIEKNYNDIFVGAKIGASWIGMHVLIMAIETLYSVEWLKFATPNKTGLMIAAISSLILYSIPKEKQLKIYCLDMQTKQEDSINQDANKNKPRIINTDEIRNMRWTMYSMFVFELFYLICFAQ